MYDRELEAAGETGARAARHQQERLKGAPDAAAAHGLAGQAGHSLLRLQRQYGNRYVQRLLQRAAEGETHLTPEVEESINRSRGGGRALDEDVRARMEPAIGADFSGVRVHTDARADTLSRAVNARAFTVGQDVYFRQGAYQPGSSSGRELLAHELTHVVQQSGTQPASAAPSGGIQRQLTVSQPGDKYEQEADQVAQAVTRQEQRASSVVHDAAPPVQRQAEEEKKKESVQTKAEAGSLQRQADEEPKDESM
ncbi:MAG TPA: DUF4157 domain-containing protein [Blastocatellia bacterium]|nr:DUF4157 domain-containing protein [Blastocatellia bacterium]